MIMPFGKYKGRSVSTLPEDYLMWLWDSVDLRGRLRGEVEAALFDNAVVAMPQEDQVKTIYRELAFKWHPDRGGCVEAMQAVNEFYERLKNQ